MRIRGEAFTLPNLVEAQLRERVEEAERERDAAMELAQAMVMREAVLESAFNKVIGKKTNLFTSDRLSAKVTFNPQTVQYELFYTFKIDGERVVNNDGTPTEIVEVRLRGPESGSSAQGDGG